MEAPEQLHQLETFANQIALALEQGPVAEEPSAPRFGGDRAVRNSLLSSVSHDFRTPVASHHGHDQQLVEDWARQR